MNQFLSKTLLDTLYGYDEALNFFGSAPSLYFSQRPDQKASSSSSSFAGGRSLQKRSLLFNRSFFAIERGAIRERAKKKLPRHLLAIDDIRDLLLLR